MSLLEQPDEVMIRFCRVDAKLASILKRLDHISNSVDRVLWLMERRNEAQTRNGKDRDAQQKGNAT